MDSQSPQQSHHQHQKVEIVAQQLLKAFNSDSQSDPNIIIFLSKLYKNNSPLKNKKMKSIRLNQFINFLQHVVIDFPSTKEDIELIYYSVLSTLTNDKNFTDDEDYELIESIGYEIAKIIEKLTQSTQPNLGLRLLSYLTNEEDIKQSMMDIIVFDQTLKNSKYFQTITLDQFQTTHSHHTVNQDKYKWHILQQLLIGTIILDNVNFENIYSLLFNSVDDKIKVVGLFYEHVKKLTKTLTKSKRNIFIDCFITNQQKLSKNQIQAILKIMQKQTFDRETINEVVTKITQQKVSLQELVEIEFKGIKGVEQVFVQCLIQQSSKKSITQLIQLFLSMKSSQNYFPLYLILKSPQKVPLQYMNLFFEQNKLFTVRKGIIYTLSIVDNELSSFGQLMKFFELWNGIERIRTRSEYNIILKSVHFSLQNVSKANVISHILRHIHNKQNLNKQCKLQFITYNTLRVTRQQQMKSFTTQSTRSSLCTLFRILNEFDCMTRIGNQNINNIIICQQMKSIQFEHKYKIDLEFLLSTNPYVEQQITMVVKQLNKLLSVNIQQLMKQLPQVKQPMLEVTLMWLNNKLETFYQQQVNTQTVDWAVKTYKKLTNDLHNELKSLLQKQKLQPYYKLIKTLIEYTIQKQQSIHLLQQQHQNKIFYPQIVNLINSGVNNKEQRMNSNNFNDYFLSHSKYKHYLAHNDTNQPLGKYYKKIIWIKTLLIQIKILIKNIVKAEKLSNRKQIKNIIADNVADVLAFKVIHQYFDAEVQQTPEILINAFRNIQPDMEFFEKTQALASSLNIEFYSIFQELPNLLENFNSDTLIFLSKLILNPKPPGEEKRKTTKKKKDKENHPEDSIALTVIAKNFQLLFGNPNQMESFKSLFMILRKLIDVQKVNPQQFQKHLNNWLSEINFISCANFQTWKNKVLSLSKMWKIAADLINDKRIQKHFQISVLEKHFNLFTDLLNKLYENFRKQPDFLDLQQRILLSLCLIYKNQDFSQIIEEQNSMVEFMIKRFQQRNMSRIVLQNKFYFCNQCKKNACYACTSFLHRNHDKNFIGKTGICEHEANSSHKSKKQTLLKAEYSTSILGGVSAILKKNEDLPQDVLQRISQKLLLDQQLRANEDGEFIGRFRDSQAMRQLLQSRLSRSKGDRTQELKKKLRQKENLFMKELKKEEEEELEEDEKIMTPQAEEYFQYKESYCKEFKKIHSEFIFQSPKIKKVVPKINTSPLARVFLRELQENHFYNEEIKQKSIQNALNQSINIEQIKERYQFFKNNNLKADSGRDFGFGRGRGGYGGGLSYGQNPRQHLNSHRRNVIACNKKYLLLPSSMSIMNLSMSKLRQKLQKKIQNKQFNNIQQQKNFVNSPTVNLPFQIFQLTFSNSPNNPCLAVVGYNQLCFYSINADGRFGRQMNPEFSRIDNIVKFSWINEKKNLFAIAFTNYIRIGGISSNNNIKPFSKAQIGKTIRDFDGYMNSKTYVLFILDTQGKLYYIDVDFKQGKSTAYSPQDRMITLKDQNDVIIKDQIYSVKSIDGNRLLISFPNGIVRIAQTSRQSNIWTTKKLDLKKIMKIDNLLVLEAIKIVKFDDQSVTFAAIGRKLSTFESTKQRKCTGQLILVTFNTQNINLSSIYFTKQENIESYDMSTISSGQIIVVSLNDEGSVHIFKHGVDIENKQIVERINAVMDGGSVRALCEKLLDHQFFEKVEEGGMLRNLQFKQNKAINNAFTINTTPKSPITIRESHPHNTFISGISFQVQLPSSFTQYSMQDTEIHYDWIVQLKVKLLDSSYVFKCSSKIRQIQLGLNIKQSLELFARENEIEIVYEIGYNKEVVDIGKLSEKEKDQFVKVKNIQIFGFEAKDLYTSNNNNNSNTQVSNSHPSPYHTAFKELFIDWHTYQQYLKQSFEQYLLNPYRQDLYNIDIKKFFKLRNDHSQTPAFKPDQINLLLKLQLLSQTLSSDKHYTKQNLEDYLIAYRKLLLARQYPRKSLQNSVYRVGYSLCELYEKHVAVSVGHPYHGQTMISLHIIVSAYNRWQQRKNLFTFDNLCTTLSNLIFTSAINLHIILQCIPQLIIQLSQYFRQLITGQKTRQFSEQQNQVSLTRTCSRYIGIMCEYYQVMKNKGVVKIEQKMLYLLQQVFGQCKSDIPKQLVMNPFLYLQSIFSFNNDQIQLQSTIDIYSIQQNNQSYQSESFYTLDKKNKEKLLIKKNEKEQQQLKQIEGRQLKIEEQRELLRQNSRWEAIIEDEKDIEEEENQMYMEIEEEFDDQEELELVVDEGERGDAQDRKQPNNQQSPLQNQPQQPPISPIHPNLQQKIATVILSHCHPSPLKLTINHSDFPFQLAIALFRKQHYLNENNIYFYLGLLYNLLKIIENNLKISVNKSKILQFIETVDGRVEQKEYASLFIVLNFFVAPRYHRIGNKQYHVHKSLSTLSEHFVNYYKHNIHRFTKLLTIYNPKSTHPIAKFSSIMRFTKFDIQNQLYNLRFIANLYLSFRLNGYNVATKKREGQNIKQELLFKLVKHKLSVLKNIMLYQKWLQDLDRAKVLVGFEMILSGDHNQQASQKQQGIDMLYSCAHDKPQKFVQQLLKDEGKVTFLEEYALETAQLNENTQTKILQLLEIYYKS